MAKNITTEEHIEMWRHMRETTSAGPTGLHFGHLIAGTYDEQIANLDASLAHMAFVSGYASERCQDGTNVMLVKKEGKYLPEELRTILLFDVQFNGNNKLLGRRMMTFAEELNLIAPEQYGSRKHKSAMHQCMNKRLTFDLWRQLKWPAAMSMSDLKSCYDRIVHSIASLAMQRIGTPIPPIFHMFNTIQNLKHFVRTAYGDSKRSFGGHLWAVPCQGVGQGNGAGPQIWALVSTPVLNYLREVGVGVTFATSITAENIRFVGYAFVDDTDLCQMALTEEMTAEEVAMAMQVGMEAWEGAMRATGAAVVPAKSHWYLIDFKWKDGRWSYATTLDRPNSLTVKDHLGVRSEIQRLEPSQAERTLGVRLAPDGNNETEKEYLYSVANEWSLNARSGRLDHRSAWFNLTTVILAKLRYPLPVTTLTEAECDYIMSPILKWGLPACHVCRNFDRTMVYAPTKFQGLGIPNLYTLQGIGKVRYLVDHLNSPNDITGQLLRASAECLRLELGVSGPLLLTDVKKFGCLATKSLLEWTWRWLHEHGIRLYISTPTPPLQRQYDRYLMEDIEKRGFRGSDLQAVNRCRLFLKAFTLADITSGDGNYVIEDNLHGTQRNNESKYTWPRQQRPPTGDWNVWRKAIRETFCDNSSYRLYNPLRKWITTSRKFRWYHSESEQRIYKMSDSGWNYLSVNLTRSRVKIFRETDNTVSYELPSDLRRTVTVEKGTGQFVITGTAEEEENEPLEPTSFWEYLSRLPSSAAWALELLKTNQEGSAIAEAIRRGEAIAVTDGSSKSGFGTSSWTIEGQTNETFISGSNQAPGSKQSMDSYRAELAGLYAIALATKCLCEYYHVEEGEVEVGCDNRTAVQKCFQPDWIINTSDPDFDLICATRTLASQSKVRWTPRHIKGHQDDHKDYDELDRWAKLNCDMDRKAKAHWERVAIESRLPIWDIFGEPPSCWINGTKTYKALQSEIITGIHGTAAKERWNKKKRFLEGTSEDIDWEAQGKAIASVQHSRQVWIVKHAVGMCGVGKWMKRWKQRESAECPRCQHPEEDEEHVWKCQNTEAKNVWKKSIEKLREWMTLKKTDPELRDGICLRLNEWRDDLPKSDLFSRRIAIQQLFEQQDKVGWRVFLEGCVVLDWAAVQQDYYTRIVSRKTGKRWVTELIQKLWQVAWDQWEHRNGILHKKEERKVHELLSRETDRALRTEYTRGMDGLPSNNAHFFSKTLLELLKADLQSKRLWVANVRTARKHYYSR
jgi:Reverse transcriptase (RNA-dependent DNA polymerase)